MYFKILCILSVVLHFSLNNEELLSKFYQTDYKVKDIRVELVDFDRKAIRYINLTTFKYNRTTPSVNSSWSFLFDPQDKLQMLVQGYKFASNEYRHFPIRYLLGVTNTYKANLWGARDVARRCGFVNETYFVKDTDYYFCYGGLDESKLPPRLPTGRYKFSVTYMYVQKAISEVSAFGEVYRPIKIPK